MRVDLRLVDDRGADCGGQGGRAATNPHLAEVTTTDLPGSRMPENVERACEKESGFRASSNVKDKKDINWEDNLVVDGPSVLVGDYAIRRRCGGTNRTSIQCYLSGIEDGKPIC
jgi:hypothetical protein